MGDGASFVEEVRQKFGKALNAPAEIKNKRKNDNITQNNEEMRKKQEGLTLGEKIAKQLEKIKSKKVARLIDEAFFQETVEDESRFYVRRHDQFSGNTAEGRLNHVEDEVAVAARIQAELDAAEALRDQTFEEFKFKYEDHIEGKAPNHRTARASNYGDLDAKSTRSRSVKGKGKRVASSRGDDEEDDAKSFKSRKSTKADMQTAEEINKELENMRYEIPDSCFVKYAKNTKIEKLEAKFVLLAHPYPSLEGEMLLVQPKKEDQADKETVIYRDYSLRNRMPNREKPTVSAAEKLKDKKKKDSEVSKLQCLEVAIDDPLQPIEWVNIAEVMNQIGGLTWF